MIKNIEDIYSIENGRNYNVRTFTDKLQPSFYAKFKIVGFVKNTKYLIGRLNDDSALSCDFINRNDNHTIDIEDDDNGKYIYVNISSLGGKYSINKSIEIKKKKLKKVINNLEVNLLNDDLIW